MNLSICRLTTYARPRRCQSATEQSEEINKEKSEHETLPCFIFELNDISMAHNYTAWLKNTAKKSKFYKVQDTR